MCRAVGRLRQGRGELGYPVSSEDPAGGIWGLGGTLNPQTLHPALLRLWHQFYPFRVSKFKVSSPVSLKGGKSFISSQTKVLQWSVCMIANNEHCPVLKQYLLIVCRAATGLLLMSCATFGVLIYSASLFCSTKRPYIVS